MKREPFFPALLPPKLDYDERQSFSLGNMLGRFSGLLARLPGQDLLAAPLIRREAVSSAQIEGSQSTVSDALLFDVGDEVAPEKRDDLREIRNYRRALASAEDKLRKGWAFDLTMLRGLHEILLSDSVRGSNKNPGEFRSEQNWFGPYGAPMEQAIYIPPPPEKVPELMENWLEYWRADEPSPLAQMAILHGQFEVIHPFMDGNGRIGRLLLPLFLYEKKAVSRPLFYLSARLLARREEYYARLAGLDSLPGDWRGWNAFFLKVCEEQAEENIRLCDALADLHGQLTRRTEKILRSRFAIGLIEAAFARPMFALRDLEFSGKRPGDLFLTMMVKKLAAAGVLTKMRDGTRGRPAIYALPSLIKIMQTGVPPS